MHVCDREESKRPEGIQSVLERIFPEENTVYECILTLMRADRESCCGESVGELPGTGTIVPNTSAVGVYRNGLQLSMKLYQGSDSYENINDNKYVVLSIPEEDEAMDIFIGASLRGYGDDEREFPDESYSYLDDQGIAGTIPVLVSCSVNIICEIQRITEGSLHDDLGVTRIRKILLDAHSIGRTGVPHEAYTRNRYPLLNALVYATRFIATGDEGSLFRTEKYLSIAERDGRAGTRKRVGSIRDVLYSSSSSRKE